MVKKMKDLKRDSIDFGKAKIEPLFHSIFFPTLLSMVFASLFTVADGIFVGQGVGSDALAAINIVAPLFLMTTGISLMFGVGVSVVASIHLAQGNNKAADINITQALEVASLLMTVFAALVYVFRVPFLRLMGCSDALMPLALEYLLFILPGCIFIISQMVGTFVIRLDGSPKYAASLEIIPGILNIFLDWLFVFPLQMGIAGSALASTLCCAVASGMVYQCLPDNPKHLVYGSQRFLLYAGRTGDVNDTACRQLRLYHGTGRRRCCSLQRGMLSISHSLHGKQCRRTVGTANHQFQLWCRQRQPSS